MTKKSHYAHVFPTPNTRWARMNFARIAPVGKPVLAEGRRFKVFQAVF